MGARLNAGGLYSIGVTLFLFQPMIFLFPPSNIYPEFARNPEIAA